MTIQSLAVELDSPGRVFVQSRSEYLTQLENNERPTWLDLAHRKLDEAVFAAYGWETTLSDDGIFTRLLALNQQRASE